MCNLLGALKQAAPMDFIRRYCSMQPPCAGFAALNHLLWANSLGIGPGRQTRT